MIARDVRERLERLIRDLPEWEIEDARRTLLDFLRDHPVWHYLDLKGGTAIAASALIDTCEQQDPESLNVLLAGLRDRYKHTFPKIREEIDRLTPYLPHGSVRRRGPWKGAPYLGLTYFDRQHAPIFFGREDVLRELVQTLNTEQGRRFTVVWGASGSGKSSLVRAGLWARLADGEITEMPGSERWLISGMTPTDLGRNDPGTALWASLLKAVEEDESFRGDSDLREDLRRTKDASISSLAERLLWNAPAEACWL